MFKPTPSLQRMVRRLQLTTKQAGKEYYKGNRVGSLGKIDKYGRFHADFDKIRTYVYPAKGVKNFELTPFVTAQSTRNIQVSQDAYRAPSKVVTGAEYLQMWKEHGGSDYVETPKYVNGEAKRGNMPEVWEEKGEKPKA
ncbi:unnamed protein product [Periconia digitata]|uniref:Mitochondrial ribosomal protein L27 n=1 Tax=Periconia digitata TaxID=1303443 RepID=A0A9W4XS41_9PLEO|nr:unnamed protein product [Periconia digitata]